jgi:hypothetical protein
MPPAPFLSPLPLFLLRKRATSTTSPLPCLLSHRRRRLPASVSFPPQPSSPSAVDLPSSPVSSNYRTRRRPHRPPELRRRHGTPPRQAVFSALPPPTVSNENPTVPPCSAQPSSPPMESPLGQANNAGPQAEMPAQHCAAIFQFSIFI